MIPDAHTHIHTSRSPLHDVHRALARGVGPVVVCATSPLDFASVLDLRSACGAGNIIAGLGIHPWNARIVEETGALSALRSALQLDLHLHIGEIGLDKSPRGLSLCPLDVQTRIFTAQLTLAAQESRAVNVHCVRAYSETAAAFASLLKADDATGCRRIAGVLMHSWGGSLANATALRDVIPSDTPLLFSFQGDCVVNVIHAFEKALSVTRGSRESDCISGSTASGISDLASCSTDCDETAAQTGGASEDVGGCVCGAIAGPQPSTAAPSVALTRGASKQVMACLAKLPRESLVFETDAPYQAFPSHGEFDSWCDAVFGSFFGVHEVSPAAVSIECTEATYESPERSTAPPTLTGDATDGDSCVFLSHHPPVQNSPERVIRIAQAAAVWRCLHALKSGPRRTHAVATGPKKLISSLAELESSFPVNPIVKLLAAPGSGWPTLAAVREEYASLVSHAARNLRRVFASSYV